MTGKSEDAQLVWLLPMVTVIGLAALIAAGLDNNRAEAPHPSHNQNIPQCQIEAGGQP